MDKCKICGKEKSSTKARMLDKKNILDPRFVNPILTVRTLVICDDCYKDYREGKILIKD